MRQKALQIRDLIERAKAEADVGLHGILNKWENANEHVLRKYPEGAKMDFTLLEKADVDRAAGDENDVRRNKNTRKPAMNQAN